MLKPYTFIVLVILLMASCKRTREIKLADTSEKDRLEAYLDSCNANGLSAGVLVAKDGEILYQGGLGLRNKEENLPVNTSTVFTTGSLTKQFTSTAILKLQEEGKLSVHDTITAYFRGVPRDKKDITLHQLLTHSSGITDNLGYGVDFNPIIKADFLRSAFNSPLDFTPGTGYSYSNVGYSLLAMIIEQVTELDYEAYLREHLFKKAGMKDTGYILPDWDTGEIAHGYKCGEDWGTHLQKWQDSDNEISWHLKGNGGILSTPTDLYRWYLALQNGEIISAASLTQLTYPHVQESESGDSHYAYGWTVFDSSRNTKIIAHNGSNGVFYADYLQLPEENTVIIYMTNELRYDTQVVAWEIEQLLFDENYTPVVPKMKARKVLPKGVSAKPEKIVNQFAELILSKNKTTDPFIDAYLADQSNAKRFKSWTLQMQQEFSGYALKHILAYDDMSFDIVLTSPEGENVQLTPCFDLQFNTEDQIVAFGW